MATSKKPKRKPSWTENLEKYVLVGLSVIVGAQLSLMAWKAIDIDTQASAVLMGGYVIFGVAVVASMLLRKLSKYSNLTRLKIGPDGLEIDAETKELKGEGDE